MSIRDSAGDKVFLRVVFIFLLLCFLIVLYPLIYIVSASLSDARAVLSGRVWLWPVDITLDGYRAVFKSQNIMLGYKNSLIYTVIGTVINMIVTTMCAYPLSRRDLPGRNGVMALFAVTMVFNGGLIPSYLVVKNLNMIDTIWAMVIPTAMSVWNMIIMRTFFENNIPPALTEAAHLDGCGDIRFILSIALPLSKPIMAVMVLYYGVVHWNSYFNALIYLKTSSMYPLQIMLRNILILSQMDSNMVAGAELNALRQGMIELIRYAIIVIASAPLLCLYPIIQKYFVQGVMIGAIKG